jgi:KDO2-lipid IV(A) lauroyltransferase
MSEIFSPAKHSSPNPADSKKSALCPTFAPMNRVGFIFTRLVVEMFRFMPFWLLYRLSDGLAFLLHRVVGYRRQVVWDNLRRSFPEKTDAELAGIARKSYRNLTDVMLEALKSYTLPVPEISRRCPVLNPEMINQFLDRKQSVILSGAHYGNWEYTGITMPPLFHGTAVTAFKAIANPYMDAYVNQTRERTGMVMVSMDDTFAAMRRREQEGRPSVYILLADQSPSNRKGAHWVEFLGQDTASLPGVDVLARRFKFPVLFYEVRRVRRGFYEVVFSEICTDPTAATEASITRAFAQTLETVIRKQPENWLWSHKRWKMKR